VCLVGLIPGFGVWAQASTGFGAVSGIVTQAGADGMPEAMVVLSNSTLGTQVTMLTTDDGVFNAAAVTPAGGYALKVTRQGYQTWQSAIFSVSAGQMVEFNVPLQTEGTAAKLNVAGAPAPELEIDKTGTSEQVTPQQVDLLPPTHTSCRSLR